MIALGSSFVSLRRVNSRTLYAIAGLAFTGLIIAYLHAEYYTVYGPFIKLRDWEPVPTWAMVVRQTRWLVRGMAVVSLATLVLLEARRGVVSRLLGEALQNRLKLTIILILLGTLSGFYLMLPGYLTAASGHGDNYTHLAWMIRDALDHGQFPIWSNWGDMGFPFMQFNSPLYFTTVALASYVIPNIWISVKVVLFVLHILSVMAMFLFVHKLTQSRCAGLAASFAIGFAYYRYHSIVYFNSFNRMPTFLIWPMQLYFVEQLLRAKDGRRAGIGLALFSAFGLLAHFYYGAAGGFLVTVYAVVRLCTIKDELALEKKRAATRLIWWLTLGVLASLFYTLPAVLESYLTVIPSRYFSNFVVSLSGGITADTLAAVFSFDGSQGTLWNYGYVGNTLLALALLGCLLALARRRRYALAPVILIVLSLFLAIGPVRLLVLSQDQYLPYLVMIATIGVGICMAELEDDRPGEIARRSLQEVPTVRKWSAGQIWWFAAMLTLIAFDMLRYSLSRHYLIPPTPGGSPVDRVAAHQWLAAHRDEFDGRILEPFQSENIWQVPMVAGLPTFQNSGDSSVYSALLTRNLRHATPNPWGIQHYSVEELFGAAQNLLTIANTDWVIVTSPSSLENRSGAFRTSDGAVLIPTGGGLPLIASTQTQIVEPQLQLAPLARKMQIDRDNATAAFIPVLASSAIGDDPQLQASNHEFTANVRGHMMEAQFVRIEYGVSSPATLQLSYSYYPYLRVTIDGEGANTFPTAFGLIGLQSPAGDHVIEIIPFLSPLRRVVGAINLAVLLLLTVLWFTAEAARLVPDRPPRLR